MHVLNADHLMLIELMRLRTGDLKIGMADLSEESVFCLHCTELVHHAVR